MADLRKARDRPREIQCVDCGTGAVRRDDKHGELICQKCGLVLESARIDPSAEWQPLNREVAEKRCTGPFSSVLIHDRGLSTEIGRKNVDHAGRSISPRSRAMAYRIRRSEQRNRYRSTKERNLALAFTEINRMASQLDLPRVVRENAAVNYRTASSRSLIRGRSTEGVAAASLYAAARQCGVPRTLEEIKAVCTKSRKEVGRCFRVLVRELRLHLPAPGPEDFLPRFCSDLELPIEVQTTASDILHLVGGSEWAGGHGPLGLATAAIYIAAILGGLHLPQDEIADKTHITGVTIRKCYKGIMEQRGVAEFCIRKWDEFRGRPDSSPREHVIEASLYFQRFQLRLRGGEAQ